MAVTPVVPSPLLLGAAADPAPPLLPERAAGVEELADGADDVALVGVTATICVEDGVLTEVITTVTGFVSVMPLLVADCVTIEVMMFVVGGTEAAEMMEVTTLVVLGATVTTESETTAEEVTAEATEEETTAAKEEETAAAAVVLAGGVVVDTTVDAGLLEPLILA